MYRTARSGSVFVLIISIVAVMIVLAAGFIRVVQMQDTSNDSANRNLLARAAAMAGTNHAIEQIIRDYTTQPFTRMDSPALAAFVAHDKPYYSGDPFTIDLFVNGQFVGINRDDIPGENNLLQIIGDRTGGSDGEAAWYGAVINELRGRFYEPEFYNLATTNAGYGANPEVTTPIYAGRTPLTTSGPLPDRNAGLFLDERLRRLPGGATWQTRQQARYRLRYAIVTTDLDGTLLVNGDQGVGHRLITTTDPSAAPTPEAARVIRNMHKVAPIVDACSQFSMEGNRRPVFFGYTGGVRTEHLYAGRGAASNHDRVIDGASATYKNLAPVTFPIMYRLEDKKGTYGVHLDAPPLGSATGARWMPNTAYAAGDNVINPANSSRYVCTTAGTSAPSGGPSGTGNGIADGTVVWDYVLHVTGESTGTLEGYIPAGPFTSSDGKVTGLPAGNEVISVPTYGAGIFSHVLIGPQFTFVNWHNALAGTGFDYFSRGGAAACLGRFSPFGRGVSERRKLAPTEPITRSRGNTDTPWCVNLLTLTPQLAYGMIASYLPPGGMASVNLPQDSSNSTDPLRHYSATGYDGAQMYLAGFRNARDLFVDKISPAFALYPAPARTTPQAINPDFHVPAMLPFDQGYRTPDNRYPGPLCINGYDAATTHVPGTNDLVGAWRNDDLGYYLRAKSSDKNYFNNTKGPTLPSGRPRARHHALIDGNPMNGDNDPSALSLTHGSGPIWGRFRGSRQPSMQMQNIAYGATPWRIYVMPHPDSIWEIVGQTLATTISVVHGQQFQYRTVANTSTTNYRDPATWFDYEDDGAVGYRSWDTSKGARATSIRDVDALFVANLGSNFLQPNSPTPVPAWKAKISSNGPLARFVPEWNLAALRTAVNGSGLALMSQNDPAEVGYDASKPSYTATERTAIIELIINDVRLSFFGSSPYYGGAFRAMDLNGDGKAHCSGFVSTGVDVAKHLDQYTTVLDANGIATVEVDTYFSNTGTFYIGKSRFWRITVRGELWDNVLQTTVNQSQLDTVLCVDPVDKANELGPLTDQEPGGGQYATHVISQSWFYDSNRALLPRRN